MITAGGQGETILLRLHGLHSAPGGIPITADVADTDVVLGFALEAESGLRLLLGDGLCVHIGSEIRISRILHLNALDLTKQRLRFLRFLDLLPGDRNLVLLGLRVCF